LGGGDGSIRLRGAGVGRLGLNVGWGNGEIGGSSRGNDRQAGDGEDGAIWCWACSTFDPSFFLFARHRE